MTVSANDRRKIYNGNGISDSFNGPRAFEAGDIQVYLIDPDGVSSLVSTGAYTLSGLGRPATRVVMGAPPAEGWKLLILRTVSLDQPTDITNQGAFLPEIHEDAFDRQVMQIQQLGDDVSRSMRFQENIDLPDGYSVFLPRPVSTQALGWNAAGNALVNISLPDIGTGTFDPQAALGPDSRLVADKLREVLSVRDLGAVGDGIADDTAALNAAVAEAKARNARLFFPRGTYLTTTGIRAPSNAYFFGEGMHVSVVKLADSAAATTNVVTNESNPSASFDRDITLVDMGFDGNVRRLADSINTQSVGPQIIAAHAGYQVNVSVPGLTSGAARLDARYTEDRRDVSLRVAYASDDVAVVTLINNTDKEISIAGGTVSVGWYSYTLGGSATSSAVALSNVHGAQLIRIKGTAAAKHGCDISATTYTNPGHTDKDGYGPGPSTNILVQGCEWSYGGDDNFTTHSSEYVWIVDNYSYDSHPTYVIGNGNAFEIDEGSRNIWLINPRAINCSSGLEIKGHPTTPAANHVYVTNPMFDHSIFASIDISHPGHGLSAEPVSPTGSDVVIAGGMSRYSENYALRLLAYNNVVIRDHAFVDDGRSAADFRPIDIEDGARNILLSGVSAVGFDNCPQVVQIQETTTENVRLENCYFQGGTLRSIGVAANVGKTRIMNCTMVASPNVDPMSDAAVRYVSNFRTGDHVLFGCTQTGFSGLMQDPDGGRTDAHLYARNITTSVANLNTSTTLGAHLAGVVLEKTGNTAYTYTLPPDVFVRGDIITVVNTGTAGDVTVARGSGVALYAGGSDADVTVAPGTSARFYLSNTANRWIKL